jgi:ABC-type nickel/cobalt efflux system permease component RcnA
MRRGWATGRRRVTVRFALVATIATIALPVLAPAASAHPLGNATVNHYDGLTIWPHRVDVDAVEDVAEIPTLQRKPVIDANGDSRLSASERAAYATRRCAALAAAERLAVSDRRLALRVASSAYTERHGVIGLTVGRLECRLTSATALSGRMTLTFADDWDSAGIGWHELTAVGAGVTLVHAPVPARSVSDQLRHYPNDLLTSPLDVRSVRLTVVPGDAPSTYAATRRLPVAGWTSRALNRLNTVFDGLVGTKHLGFGVGALAVLVAMLLGAGHAFLPGHGKTIMAAYLVGRRGRLSDVVVVGATVTVTHTAGVLLLGLALSLSSSFAPTAVEQGLGVVSGAIVAGVGLWLFVSALRRRRASGVVAHGHSHAPGLDHTHSHDAAHAHGHDHSHGHGHAQDRGHAHGHDHPAGFGRGGLIGLGAAGGLVPSPSALLVLLAAIALGRTAYGVVLVLAYGLGMAAALTAAGLLLVRLRGRLAGLAAAGRFDRLGRAAAVLPVATACLVVVVGTGLVVRSLGGSV